MGRERGRFATQRVHGHGAKGMDGLEQAGRAAQWLTGLLPAGRRWARAGNGDIYKRLLRRPVPSGSRANGTPCERLTVRKFLNVTAEVFPNIQKCPHPLLYVYSSSNN